METVWVLLDRYEANHCSAIPCIPKTCSRQLGKMLWSMVSKLCGQIKELDYRKVSFIKRTQEIVDNVHNGHFSVVSRFIGRLENIYLAARREMIGHLQEILISIILYTKERFHTGRSILRPLWSRVGFFSGSFTTAGLWLCGKMPEVSESLTIWVRVGSTMSRHSVSREMWGQSPVRRSLGRSFEQIYEQCFQSQGQKS